MPRCVAAGPIAFLMAALIVPLAQAQVHRNFPATALRGELFVGEPPDAQLNGNPARLAPGARIRGENNLLATPGSLAGRKWIVHYTRELGTGLLMDVWVLNTAERARKAWPMTDEQAKSWVFDPVGQTWSKP